MKKFFAPAIVVGLLLVMASCQKELSLNDITNNNNNNNPTPVAGTSLVKTYTEAATSGSNSFSVTFNLTYDASNRLVNMVSTSDPGFKFVYQYNGNESFTLAIYNSNTISVTGKTFIKNGLMDSTIQYNDTQDTTAERYLYDGNKQLTQIKEYEIHDGVSHLVGTRNITWGADGNVASEQQGADKRTYTYTTLPDNLNTGNMYAYRNKNLVKTTTDVSGGITITSNHTYTFDSQNRQTSEKIVVSSGEILTKSYTY